MKAAVLGLAMFAAVAVPGGVKLGEVVVGADAMSVISMCRNDKDMLQVKRQFHVPVATAVVPGMGEVKVTRRIDAGCGCLSGKPSCEVGHATEVVDADHWAQAVAARNGNVMEPAVARR